MKDKEELRMIPNFELSTLSYWCCHLLSLVKVKEEEVWIEKKKTPNSFWIWSERG